MQIYCNETISLPELYHKQHIGDTLPRLPVDKQNRMPGSPFDIFSPLYFPSAKETSSIELATSDLSIPLSTFSDCFKSHESIFTQLHNICTVSGFNCELTPQTPQTPQTLQTPH
jgi:hypothetical protein